MFKHFFKVTFLVFISLFISERSYCQELESVEVSETEVSYNLKNKAFIFKEKQAVLSPQEAWESSSFEPFNYDIIDSESEIYWLKVKIANLESFDVRFYISLSFLDEVEIYQSEDGKVKKINQRAGFLLPLKERTVSMSQQATAYIKLKAKKKEVYLFRIISKSIAGKSLVKPGLEMGFMGYTFEGADFFIKGKLHFNYFTLGALLMVIAFNLLVFIWSKERNMLFLIMFNATLVFSVCTKLGFLVSLDILPDFAADRVARGLSVFFATIAYAIYTQKILRFEEFFKTGNLILNILIVIQIIGIGATLSGNGSAVMVAINILTIPVFLFAIVGSAIITYQKKIPGSVYFFIASVIITLGYSSDIIFRMSNEYNYFYGYIIVRITLILEAIIFSIGVVYEMVENKKKVIQAESSKQQTLDVNKFLKSELDSKNRQLVGNTTLIISRNDKIMQLQQKIKTFRKSKDISQDKIFQELDKELKKLLSFENDWNGFKRHFEEVHPAFFEKLIVLQPSLTKNDIRLSAFLKMNLTTKEIALVLNASVRSMEQSRTRFRKKLDIPPDMKVSEFLDRV